MRSDDIDRLLSARLTPPNRDRERHRRGLEEELRARHGRLYPRRKRWNMLKQTTWFRPVVATLAVLVLGIAACNAPTEYDVKMGQRMTIDLNDSAKDMDFDTLQEQLAAIEQFVADYPGTEALNVNIAENSEGQVSLGLMIWGQDLDGAALQQDLVSAFPALAEADFQVDPLEGTVEGNLGEAFGHAVFDLHVEGETAEEIRAQIMQQLAEQGFDGDAEVNVQMDEETGLQTIDIELTDDVVEGDAAAGGSGGGEIGDRIVIEKKTD